MAACCGTSSVPERDHCNDCVFEEFIEKEETSIPEVCSAFLCVGL